MAKAPAVPPDEGTQKERGKRQFSSVDAAIRDGVITGLGSPPNLYQVSIVPLWKGHYRVNLMTGTDPASIRIPHSFFVVVSEDGAIVSATPPIVRTYP